MITWTETIEAKDKEVIESFFKRIEEVHSLLLDMDLFEIAEEFGMDGDSDGGFSDIIFYKDYALKHTSSWDYELNREDLNLQELILQLDSEVVLDLKEKGDFGKILPIIYGYNHSWVIMQRMKGDCLSDHIVKENLKQIPPELKPKILNYIEKCIDAGWYPLDLQARCFFPFEEEGLKVIDFNMYQQISELKKEVDSEIDWNLPTADLAKELYERETLSMFSARKILAEKDSTTDFFIRGMTPNFELI